MDTKFDDSGAMYVDTVEYGVYKLPPEPTQYAITFTKPAVIEITDKDKNVHKYDVNYAKVARAYPELINAINRYNESHKGFVETKLQRKGK